MESRQSLIENMIGIINLAMTDEMNGRRRHDPPPKLPGRPDKRPWRGVELSVSQWHPSGADMVTTVAVPQQPHIPFMHLEGSGENMLRDCKNT